MRRGKNVNARKVGLIGAGVLTAMLAVSPLAFATEGHDHPAPGKVCSFEGGNAGAASDISDNAPINIVGQLPVGGNNILNAGNCSEFLNNNLNDNLSNNIVEALSGILS